MSRYLWSCEASKSRLAGFTVALRWPLPPECCVTPRLLQRVCVLIRDLRQGDIRRRGAWKTHCGLSVDNMGLFKLSFTSVDLVKLKMFCYFTLIKIEGHVLWLKAPEQLLNGPCGETAWYLHGLRVLLGVVGLGGGDVGEGILCDHGDLGGGGAVGVVVPLLRPPVLVVAVCWLRWILWWHRGEDGTALGFLSWGLGLVVHVWRSTNSHYT